MKQKITGQIVSPPFACGLPWLVNVLLDLGIQMTSGEFEAGCVEHSVLWGSRLDWAGHPERRTILLIRDPRDAIYALYQAQRQTGVSYDEYLFNQQAWSVTTPGLLKLSPADACAYFGLFWMAMADVMDVHIVRHEDICQNPEAAVSRVVAFLGFERTQTQIAKAVTTAHEAPSHALIPDKPFRDFWFSPRASGEWKGTHSRLHLDFMDGPANYFMHLQGYEIDSIYNYAEAARKMPQALSEMSGVLHGLLQKIRRLDQYGDADMVRRSILGAANVFSATSLERAWTAIFFHAYEWVESILPLAEGHAAQRKAAFDMFCLLNSYFLVMPTICNAMQDVFARLDVRVSIEDIRSASSLTAAPAP
jgi:hypothetical protein